MRNHGMASQESQSQESGAPSRGREALSTQAALTTQIALMRLMIPERLKPYFEQSDGETIGIEDKLFERWAGKYSPFFNTYCDLLAENHKLFSHMENEELSMEELNQMKDFIEVKAGALFTDSELNEFIGKEVHHS